MSRKGRVEEKKQNKKGIVVFLLLIILICVVIIVYLLFFKEPKQVDYAPGKEDKNIVLLPNSGDKMEAQKGGGAVSLSYSNKVDIDLKSGQVSVNFKNPSRSTQSMVLQVIINQKDTEVVVAESNRIPPSYAIYELNLKENITLSKGEYDGKFNVMYYDEETDEKAIVNTNIPVKITVK